MHERISFRNCDTVNFLGHTTKEYWNKLLFKHPELQQKLSDVIKTLENPTEIRKSKRDAFVFLFYSSTEKYWLCVVIKKTGLDGFLVTAYITDKVKEGDTVWPK